jgi:hypothetical protein
MTRDELKKILEEKEILKQQTETVYMQLIGQIQLLNTLIQKEETIIKDK